MRMIFGSNELSRRTLLKLTAAGALATAASGLPAIADDARNLTVAFGVDPTTLNPLLATSIPGRSILNHMFDKLLWFDNDGNLIPKLAESWEYQSPTSLVFKLRKDVKWHDGTPFTADDVIFTINAIRFPERPSWLTAHYKAIADVVRIDDHTLEIKTDNPDRTLLRNLTLSEIVSKRAFEENPGTTSTQAVGTGPFKFISYQPGNQVVVEKNEDYWGEPAKIDKITFRIIPEVGTRIAELRSGNVQFIDNVSPDQIPAIEGDGGLELMAGPSLRTMYVAIRGHRDLLKDIRVRQAVAHAIDKEAIVASLLGGLTQAVNSPVAPSIPGFAPSVKGYSYDPQKARQLLTDAGAIGSKIVVAYPTGRYVMDKQIGEVLASFLQAVGFEVSQQSPEWGIYYTTARSGAESPYDIALLGWGGDTRDPNWVLWEHFQSDAAKTKTGYSNPEVDALLIKAKATIDDAEAAKLYQQIQQIVVEDSSWIPLYLAPNIWARSKSLNGVELRTDEFMLFNTASLS